MISLGQVTIRSLIQASKHHRPADKQRINSHQPSTTSEHSSKGVTEQTMRSDRFVPNERESVATEWSSAIASRLVILPELVFPHKDLIPNRNVGHSLGDTEVFGTMTNVCTIHHRLVRGPIVEEQVVPAFDGARLDDRVLLFKQSLYGILKLSQIGSLEGTKAWARSSVDVVRDILATRAL